MTENPRSHHRAGVFITVSRFPYMGMETTYRLEDLIRGMLVMQAEDAFDRALENWDEFEEEIEREVAGSDPPPMPDWIQKGGATTSDDPTN